MRGPRPAAPFPPPPGTFPVRCRARRAALLGGHRAARRNRGPGFCPPAEGEGALHQRPVAAHRPIGTDLVLTPPQAPLDLLVLLLDPVPQPVEAHHRGDVGPGHRQRRRQVPGRRLRQGRRVGGGDHQAAGTVGAIRPRDAFQRPPGRGVSVAEVPLNRDPGARPRGALPASVRGHLLPRVERRARRPPGVGGLQGHDGLARRGPASPS